MASCDAMNLGNTIIVRTDHMVTPREIRVRLRWADGHIDTLPKPINSNKFEVKQQASTGGWHSFDDANEVDAGRWSTGRYNALQTISKHGREPLFQSADV